MATISITDITPGYLAFNGYLIPQNILAGYPLKYTGHVVKISLSASDLPDVTRGPVEPSFVYPPAHVTRPKNLYARTQQQAGIIAKVARLPTFGKEVDLGQYDSTSGIWSPTNGEYSIIADFKHTDGSGDYYYSRIYEPYIIGPNDSGIFAGSWANITGDGSGTAFVDTLPAPIADVYFFYLDLDVSSNPWGIGSWYFSIGITGTEAETIYGADCVGMQIVFNGGNVSLHPTYRATGNLVYNDKPAPSILRGPTFSYRDNYQQAYQNVYCVGGVASSQDILTPLGTPIYTPNNYARWCASGFTEIILIQRQSGLMADTIFRAYFYNQFGKVINPSGTVLSGTTHEDTVLLYGRGEVNGYAYLTVTPPAKACAYKVTSEYSVVDPGVEQPTYIYSYNRGLPRHYASDYGDFVPGNVCSTYLGESDMP